MREFLFQKDVDQSLLKSGLTIPVDMQEKIQEALGVSLAKGQRANIKILLDDQIYDAILTHVNFSEEVSNRTVFQIRYAEGSSICIKLKSIFASSDLSAPKGERDGIEVR